MTSLAPVSRLVPAFIDTSPAQILSRTAISVATANSLIPERLNSTNERGVVLVAIPVASKPCSQQRYAPESMQRTMLGMVASAADRQAATQDLSARMTRKDYLGSWFGMFAETGRTVSDVYTYNTTVSEDSVTSMQRVTNRHGRMRTLIVYNKSNARERFTGIPLFHRILMVSYNMLLCAVSDPLCVIAGCGRAAYTGCKAGPRPLLQAAGGI